MRIVAIIPARGGSKGIPRKNIKLLNGTPLIAYAIKSAYAVADISDVVVNTDDEEIADVALTMGAKVIMRPKELARDDVTLDPVIFFTVRELEQKGEKIDIVITLQPTSPLLSVKTLKMSIDYFINENKETVISVVNDPHLSWGLRGNDIVPLYERRVNRQQLPPNYRETGAFVITRREYITENTRFGSRVDVYEIPEREAIDIDTKEDWLVCQHLLLQKKILIVAEGTRAIGLGHIYRSILLASVLFEHDVLIVTTKRSELGIGKLEHSNLRYEVVDDVNGIFNVITSFRPDIVINDIIDTEKEFILKEKLYVERVVNFEDKGEGGSCADAVINALYKEEKRGGNYYWGEKYYCLRDEFILTPPRDFSEKVNNILICFGGSDPSGFNDRMLDVIERIKEDNDIHYQFVLGIGYEENLAFESRCKRINKNIDCVRDVPSMAKYMNKADIAISAQGRTIYELASQRVPSIILAQNDREYTHEFAFLKNGFINLGNGNNVSDDTIIETISWLIHSPQIRKQMYDYMAAIHLDKGIDRVRNIILGEE